MNYILSASVFDKFSKAFLEQGRWKMYLEGLVNTLTIAILAAVIGTIIGVFFAMVNYLNKKTGKLKILSKIANLYITIIRGTPVVLQLFILYFVVFASWNFDDIEIGIITINVGIIVGAITFGLNSGAYVAEIARAGFESVDDGQMEAGRSLGLSTGQTMWHIVIPQAVKNCLPPLFNEFITLVKETAIVGYVGIMDTKNGAEVYIYLGKDVFVTVKDQKPVLFKADGVSWYGLTDWGSAKYVTDLIARLYGRGVFAVLRPSI